MSGDCCKVVRLDGVEVQENGIIRDSRGWIIGHADTEWMRYQWRMTASGICPCCGREALLCPFCGGETETWDGAGPWHVVCTKCGAIGPPCLSEAEAIAAWNSRAERTCKQEERGWSTEGDHARVWLTCGHDCMVPTVQDLPNYCPNCGCKVVGK